MKHNTPYPAQADNLAVDRAVSLLRTSANVLLAQAAVLQQRPTRHGRAALKRVLSGVLADVETVRISIRE